MPQYTRQDGDAMRQDAIRRSKEMYHRAAIPQPTPQRNYDFLPLREESGAASGGMKKNPLDLGNLLGGWIGFEPEVNFFNLMQAGILGVPGVLLMMAVHFFL